MTKFFMFVYINLPNFLKGVPAEEWLKYWTMATK